MKEKVFKIELSINEISFLFSLLSILQIDMMHEDFNSNTDNKKEEISAIESILVKLLSFDKE